ncbi:hypothetical protein [Pseudonocardia sp. GCM10023141]|uniref:hypothetical protein n=1 Tax=Pseudonocardia sp. GCM10023141 TaxID=3252653 RepID=UPI0036210BFA
MESPVRGREDRQPKRCTGMPERRTHDYYRHATTSLFATFNIADGTVIGEPHRKHRAIEFRTFLITIDKTVPAELDVHLICDDYATHETPAIKGLAGGAPPLPPALHPDRILLDQPGRALVRVPHRPEDPPRHPQERPGPRGRHPVLDRGLERPPAPVHRDQDRRGDPRITRTIL